MPTFLQQFQYFLIPNNEEFGAWLRPLSFLEKPEFQSEAPFLS